MVLNRYWLLRSLKDPIVAAIVGVEYIPTCKMLSLVVVFTLVSGRTLSSRKFCDEVYKDNAKQEAGDKDHAAQVYDHAAQSLV